MKHERAVLQEMQGDNGKLILGPQKFLRLHHRFPGGERYQPKMHFQRQIPHHTRHRLHLLLG